MTIKHRTLRLIPFLFKFSPVSMPTEICRSSRVSKIDAIPKDLCLLLHIKWDTFVQDKFLINRSSGISGILGGLFSPRSCLVTGACIPRA